MGIYKESVELTFVYLLEGCGKTLSKIDDTIPHTRIDMGYLGTQNVPVHRYLYESECCSVHPLAKKTSTFSCKDLRKTLSQYVMSIGQKPDDTTNVRKSFGKRTTLTGVLRK